MTLDRAKEIVAACMAHVWYREALTEEKPPSLAQYTLRELLDANHLIAERNKESTTVMMLCDDRLIAALYVLYHYPAEDQESGRVEVLAATPTAGVVVLKLLPVAEIADGGA